MKKSILLIDDKSDVKNYFDTLQFNIERSNLEFSIDTFYFNPVDRQFQNVNKDIEIEKSLETLENDFSNIKIDVIGCDYNLHQTNKTLTFDIIKRIRKFNKTATLFIYSGAMNKELLRLFGETGKKPGEKYLQVALSSNIEDFVNNRNTLPDKILELMQRPSIPLQIENFLLKYQNLKFQYNYKTFQNISISKVIIEVRKQSELGLNIVNEIIEHGLSHMTHINGFEK